MVQEDLTEGLPDELKYINRLNCIYPSFTLSTLPGEALWLLVQPSGPHSCRYVQQLARADRHGAALSPAEIEACEEQVEEFMNEDRAVVTAVQRGLASGSELPGPLHEWERTNWEFGRYVVSRVLATAAE